MQDFISMTGLLNFLNLHLILIFNDSISDHSYPLFHKQWEFFLIHIIKVLHICIQVVSVNVYIPLRSTYSTNHYEHHLFCHFKKFVDKFFDSYKINKLRDRPHIKLNFFIYAIPKVVERMWFLNNDW